MSPDYIGTFIRDQSYIATLSPNTLPNTNWRKAIEIIVYA